MKSSGSNTQRICALTVLSTPNRVYRVEEYGGDWRFVGSIIDASLEWEDGVDYIYRIEDKNGDLIATIENCPVIVEYKESEVPQCASPTST